MASEYVITWTDFAEKQLDLVYDYYLHEAGYGVARKIVLNLVRSVEILKKFPESGQVEPLLLSFQDEFRYLVEGNYKILYFIDSKSIVVIDVFDTRRNPASIMRGVE
ncbi:type II toxin-antitoxin system RelE/ParE family toxin [Algoriphagus sp. C2-6-M1]|uniref:type II toxin-antitoxin system RelE/ParE family toxin n=1 Tax=Algoriphagus persicinus TaxID=3108754 RepID=UPI002B374FEF|nr:type II toxin-antitoxin system RelE/ParE family toxin [Algoriphagus sp. C2-6-M1]MEB2781364.1 type II toxin-antitoxin system RelE/ParE family toxin [Algoriphagus sp. C2-6-M1]